MANYRHLLIRGVGVAPKVFRAKGAGSSKPVPPVGNRSQHAENLTRALDVATAEFDKVVEEQASHDVPLSKRGVLISVTGRERVKLVTGRKRPTSPGLKLYGVQRNAQTGGSDTATFYVNARSLATLQRNLEQYAAWDGPEEGDEEDEENEASANNPFKLFESAADIKAATYRDLWTDSPDRLPSKRGRTDWEVWVRNDLTDAFVDRVIGLNIEEDRQRTEFIEVSVQNVRATPEQIQDLVRSTGAVVELRSASQLNSDYFDAAPQERYAADQAFVSRVRPAEGVLSRVTVLDTGIDHSNPLLSTAITPTRCHVVVPGWSTNDSQGHGTKMAGVIQFLDLDPAVRQTAVVPQYTELESVKVTASAGARGVPARWAIEQAVRIVERAEATPRIYCLAQTAPDEANDGRVTATSAALDLLTYNEGSPRLFCVAAGNVPVSPLEPYQVADYTLRNDRFGIESPGQAFNAITVGAITNKVRSGSATLVAPDGDLAPTSRTATSWRGSKDGKPDIVLEGGNFEIEASGVFAVPSRANLVLTTAAGGPGPAMTLVGETSAATAKAAGLLGRTRWSSPQYSAETLRGLLVHSAEWTPAMRQELTRLRSSGQSRSKAAQMIFARYGWGVPNEYRLYNSTENDFTLIIEDTITPYAKPGSAVRINEMKYFKLPWPENALRAASQAEVELKVTLSYFVEPYPQAETLDRFEHYSSTRLSFDVKQSGESDIDAQAVFNDFVGGSPQTNRTDRWELGTTAFRGSLHQDTWRGPAYLLADRNGISVAPQKGWWSVIPSANRYNLPVRFSLIVSLKAPVGIDLMSETSVALRNVTGTVVQGLVQIS